MKKRWHIVFVIIVLAFILLIVGNSINNSERNKRVEEKGEFCGNGLCERSETIKNCQKDCYYHGNDIKNENETKLNNSSKNEEINKSVNDTDIDPICGNNVCERIKGENHDNCYIDCFHSFALKYPIGNYPNELGINVIRESFKWAMIEPENDDFDFDILDSFAEESKNLKMTAVITLQSNSNWATVSKGGLSVKKSSMPIDMNDYRDFIKTTVTRYNDSVKYWQIENEVESLTFWDDTSEEYCQLLSVAYEEIKKVDINAKVVLAGFTYGPLKSIGEGVNDRYTQHILYVLNNCHEYFDVIDFHQYGTWDAPITNMKVLNDIMNDNKYFKEIISTEAGDIDTRLFIDHLEGKKNYTIIEELLAIEEINNKVNEYAYLLDPAKFVWSGYINALVETGLLMKQNDESRKILYKYQAENIIKRAVLTTGLGATLFHPLCTQDDVTGSVDWYHVQMCLVDENGIRKPMFYTYQLLIEKVGDYQKVEILNDDPFIIKYMNYEGKEVIVTWKEDSEIMIDMSEYVNSNNVKITRIITELDEMNNPIFPDEEIVKSDEVIINKTPIIIEEN